MREHKEPASEQRDGRYRFFYGIRFKMTMGLLVVFLASGFFLYILVTRQMSSQLTSQIRDDMNQLWQNSNIYTRQLLMTYRQNNDEAGFQEIWSYLQDELMDFGEYRAGAYDCKGNPIEQSASLPEEDEAEARLFAAAMEGRASCRILSDRTDSCLVTFVMPVVVKDRQVGILRFEADYSDRQQENSQFMGLMLRVTALVFFVSFLLCFLILGRILFPLLRLSRLSNRVTEMMEREEIETLPTVRRTLRNRRDEIGELAKGYSRMLDTIRRQFRKIEGDKEQMQELLASRQEFFDNATHELKTPLTTIQGYAQLMQADGGEDKELLENGLSHILHESSRLHQMVVQLLEMSDNVPAGDKMPVDLAALVKDVVSSMELKAGRYGNLLQVSGVESCWITGWENRLRQLLINLIDNAIKYGTENTPIALRVQEESQNVLLAVTNQGPDIPAEALAQIFTPFYRVDKEYSREQGSAGLGLAICHKIAEAHGGRIEADSRNGQTEFRVYFPTADGEKDDGRRNIARYGEESEDR